ncbi:MAG: carbon monoxide dehydrogenase, partial [Planctomycetota bacterium]
GISKILCVANKIVEESQIDFIKDNLEDIEIIGQISYNTCVQQSDMQGKCAYDSCPKTADQINEIKKIIKNQLIK